MAALRTQAELAEAVLRELSVLDAEEVVPAEDESFVIEAYLAKFEELVAHGLELAYWNFDQIPSAVFLTVRDLVINEIAGAYGEPMEPEVKSQRETVILKRLRRHTAVHSAGAPANRSVYF